MLNIMHDERWRGVEKKGALDEKSKWIKPTTMIFWQYIHLAMPFFMGWLVVNLSWLGSSYLTDFLHAHELLLSSVPSMPPPPIMTKKEEKTKAPQRATHMMFVSPVQVSWHHHPPNSWALYTWWPNWMAEMRLGHTLVVVVTCTTRNGGPCLEAGAWLQFARQKCVCMATI